MRKNNILLLLLCMLLTAALCSCAGGENDKKEIAVIVKAVDSDFWHTVKSGVESAATEYNVSVSFEGPENEEDYIVQNELIAKAVQNGADAIVLSAIDFKKSAETVDEAVRSGVKVVTIDSDVDSKQVSMFIGTDNFTAGRVAGEAAVKGFAPESNIRIGLLNYYESTDNGRQREEGFREYIKGILNAEIAAAVNVSSNTESATAGAVSLLKNNPEINVLVGFNEWMTLGIGNAIKQLSLADKVQGVGFDTNIASIEMLETGEMDTLIVQNPFAIGYLGVEKAAELVSGEGDGEKQIYTAVTKVTRENLFDPGIQKLIFRFH
mgnify:CR=1 FL=1